MEKNTICESKSDFWWVLKIWKLFYMLFWFIFIHPTKCLIHGVLSVCMLAICFNLLFPLSAWIWQVMQKHLKGHAAHWSHTALDQKSVNFTCKNLIWATIHSRPTTQGLLYISSILYFSLIPPVRGKQSLQTEIDIGHCSVVLRPFIAFLPFFIALHCKT